MNKKREQSPSSYRTPLQKTGTPTRLRHIRAIGFFAIAAFVVAGAIGIQTLMAWLQPESSASTNHVKPTTATRTEFSQQYAVSSETPSHATSSHSPPISLPAPQVISSSDEEAPLTDDMLEPDGDNAPPEAELEHAYDILQRTSSTAHVMTENEYINALQVVATDLTALTDFGVDAVWAYALDHQQEQRTINALMPRLQSQDPAVVARARDAIASLSEALQNPASNTSQLPNETIVEDYVTRLGHAALTDADGQQRFDAIAELGGHQQIAAITALAQALNDPEPLNRNQAVLSLANIAVHNSANRASIRSLLEKTKYNGDAELTATTEQVLDSLVVAE